MTAQVTERDALRTLPELPTSPSGSTEPSPSRTSFPPLPGAGPTADGSPAAVTQSDSAKLRLAPAAGRRKDDAAALHGAQQGKLGIYRRKVAPGAQALKEAAHARYLADMRAHFDEVTSVLLELLRHVFSNGLFSTHSRCTSAEQDRTRLLVSSSRIEHAQTAHLVALRDGHLHAG